MKMDALAARGSRKDFVDLFFITQQLSLENILERGKEKYPYVRDFPLMVLQAMLDFSIADQQTSIETNPNVSWVEIKEFFRQESHRISQHWFQ